MPLMSQAPFLLPDAAVIAPSDPATPQPLSDALDVLVKRVTSLNIPENLNIS